MKKIGLLAVGVVCAILLAANLGAVAGLFISLIILYFAFKQFLKSESAVKKVFWAIVGLIALSVSAANVPAIVGLVAAYVLFVVYKKWGKTQQLIVEEEDPFTNFEKQWETLKRQL